MGDHVYKASICSPDLSIEEVDCFAYFLLPHLRVNAACYSELKNILINFIMNLDYTKNVSR